MNMIMGRLAIATALMLIAGQGFAETGTSTTTTGSGAAAGTATAANVGSFNSLSPGNQKIARSLFLAQHPTAQGPTPLSLNQIAALKEKEGWGEVFKQMKAEGLVTAKNLGQVVSNHEKALHTATTAGGRTTTSGAHHDRDDVRAARDDGHQSGTGGHDRDDVSASGSSVHHEVGGGHDRDDAAAVVTASGTTTAGATGSHGGGGAGSHGGGTHGR